MCTRRENLFDDSRPRIDNEAEVVPRDGDFPTVSAAFDEQLRCDSRRSLERGALLAIGGENAVPVDAILPVKPSFTDTQISNASKGKNMVTRPIDLLSLLEYCSKVNMKAAGERVLGKR